MNFAATIARFSLPYTVTRFAAQSFTDGKLNANAGSPLSISASVQPVTGKDLLRLPEGLRASQVLAVFTTTQLVVVNETSKIPPDQLSYKGAMFQIELEDDWQDLGNYYKYLARKVG